MVEILGFLRIYLLMGLVPSCNTPELLTQVFGFRYETAVLSLIWTQ